MAVGEDVPQRIGRFRVAGVLGAGGMGVVYRAHDDKLGRDVAIKLLHGAPDEAGRRRLLQEARAPSALGHPGICTVYEVEDQGDDAFIVMELVDGTPLGTIVPPDGLQAEAVRDFGLQIADALSHAHERRVIHRDVKPSNILVTTQGRIKVLDFGLAGRTLSDATTVTDVPLGAGPAGTIAYMAPELFAGEPASTRSDVWSLGVLLFELATGRRPYAGTSVAQLCASVLSGRPAALPTSVPGGLRKVIERCLSKDPLARYLDAGQVHAALDAMNLRRRPTSRPAARRTPARARVRSVAVLPIENLSAEPGEEYFADGMTDALIATLAQVSALRVISRTSVMRYKGTRQSLPEIARELNVDGVIEGTVVRARGRVRITAQLIHAATDTNIWAHQYETDLRDVLAVQGDVARSIAEEIRIQLTPQERSRLTANRQVDPGAYEAFLKGRHHWYRRSPDALWKALDYLQQAIELDPSYALAYAALADVYVSIGWDLFGLVAPTDAYPKAKKAVQTALSLDPHCAEAHAAQGWIAAGYDWEWDVAERGLRRAAELKPQYSQVHIWYSHFLHAMARPEESFAEARRALECDPLGSVLNMHMGWHYLYAREYDRAIEQCRKTIELDPGFILAHVFLGQACEQTGQAADAIAAFSRAADLSNRHPTYVAELAHGYAVAGRRDQALELVGELEETASRRYVAPRGIAEIYMALDDRDNAFSWLERAFAMRNGWLIHIKKNPRYDALRTDPRYLDFVQRLNLP